MESRIPLELLLTLRSLSVLLFLSKLLTVRCRPCLPPCNSIPRTPVPTALLVSLILMRFLEARAALRLSIPSKLSPHLVDPSLSTRRPLPKPKLALMLARLRWAVSVSSHRLRR
jgi:hypothetical protein